MKYPSQTHAQPLTAPPARRELGQLVSARTLSMAVVFVLLAIAFNIASNEIFLTPRNLSLLFRQASIVALVSAGVSILMIMGEIDLSIGSAVYLSGVVAASLSVTHGLGILPTFAVVLAVGVLMGLWQGFWTVTVGVPSFIVTLAGLLAFRGIGYYTTNAATIAPVSTEFSAISEGFVPIVASIIGLVVAWAACGYYIFRRHRALEALGEPQGMSALAIKLGVLTAIAAFLIWVFSGFRGIPTALLWVAAIGIALWVLMTKTIFGRNAYLTGSNREASILAGIPLARQLYVGFVLMGAMYGIAGMLMTARLGASTPTTGMYLELDAIAGAVIGGTALKGGVGTVPGAIIGAVLLATIDNGMSILNVSSFIQLVIKGLVLLFALAFDSYITKRQGRR